MSWGIADTYLKDDSSDFWREVMKTVDFLSLRGGIGLFTENKLRRQLWGFVFHVEIQR
jgi:hypothetical protein